MSDANIVIRAATVNDISALITLNAKLQFRHGDPKFINSSFLLNSLFSTSDFNKIISAEEIVAAHLGNQLIGYYLIDNYSDTINLRNNETVIGELITVGKIKANKRIGKRAQAAVDFEFRNAHIGERMLKNLLIQISGKFDLLFSSVPKSNPALKAHLAMGWQIIHEQTDSVYVIYSCST